MIIIIIIIHKFSRASYPLKICSKCLTNYWKYIEQTSPTRVMKGDGMGSSPLLPHSSPGVSVWPDGTCVWQADYLCLTGWSLVSDRLITCVWQADYLCLVGWLLVSGRLITCVWQADYLCLAGWLLVWQADHLCLAGWSLVSDRLITCVWQWHADHLCLTGWSLVSDRLITCVW